MIAARLLRQRDARERIMPCLAECAWTMLLRLWEADSSLTVSSLCYGALAPYSTALRHIALLERRGLVESVDNSEDGRSRFISLTVLAREKLDRYAEAVGESLAA